MPAQLRTAGNDILHDIPGSHGSPGSPGSGPVAHRPRWHIHTDVVLCVMYHALQFCVRAAMGL